MRSFWVGFVVLGVLCVGLRGTSSEAKERRPRRPRADVQQAPAPEPVREEEVVKGYGHSAAAARERALEKARERVEELLGQKLGVPSWRPPQELLDADYLTRCQVLRGLGEPAPVPELKDEHLLEARYQVRLTPEYLQEVGRAARRQHMSDRHLLALRGLAGLLGLLLVGTGYLRLEELTRGYATQLLRVAAAAVVALMAFGLWLSV